MSLGKVPWGTYHSQETAIDGRSGNRKVQDLHENS